MSRITTHILDVSKGKPAINVTVVLEFLDQGSSWAEVNRGVTDADGRIRSLTPETELKPGTYRLTFDSGSYFRSLNIETFYPEVVVTFKVVDADQHFHVPLLLSPFGYSTYRGS